jgi:hypothetical protein
MPSMPVDAAFLKGLIESELATVSDVRVIDHIRGMLVEPHVLLRSWSYGDQRYPCWMVLDDSADSGGEIAYCEYGFGPRCPWGLVSSGSSVEDQQMGMDSSWYPTFLGAFFESFACVALPIWRVFKTSSDGSRIAISDQGSWDATWKLVMHLRENDPTARYDCSHAISYGV